MDTTKAVAAFEKKNGTLADWDGDRATYHAALGSFFMGWMACEDDDENDKQLLENLVDKLQQLHPRAMKLMRKKKNFIVIAEDEPYFVRAYGLLREHEIKKGTWTREDEQLCYEAINRNKKMYE
jgi:hypothetical protein